MPLPPWRTSGISVLLLIFCNKSKFNFGFSIYIPCALPMAGAKASIFVSLHNLIHSSKLA